MLIFNNTMVNIQEEDGFFVSYESETISGEAKIAPSPILLEGKSKQEKSFRTNY